jgi:hypothetical protein
MQHVRMSSLLGSLSIYALSRNADHLDEKPGREAICLVKRGTLVLKVIKKNKKEQAERQRNIIGML